MCGIVGILGSHEVAPLLVEALKRLEYRGYDSAGIATVDAGVLDRRRATGKLVNLSDVLVRDPLPGRSGIGHTRWATHGGPVVANAHPHVAGRVAVVHNGIIENFRELRAELAAEGREQESQTDTELVAMLVERELDRGATPEAAVEATLKRLTGAYALAFLFDGEDDLMIVARAGSPLAVGRGDGEMFVGSDAIALSPFTDRITYLEEGDRAVLTRAGATIRDREGRLVNRPEKRIQIDSAQVEKGGHRHYMAKEMAEQPATLTAVFDAYLDGDRILLPGAGLDFAAMDRLTMVACGTAAYACLVARYWFERIAGLPTDVDVASEFRYREPPLGPATAAIFVSQSGETADTLAALRYCQGRAKTLIAVVNAPESSIARESDVILPLVAGPEIGVASTKAFTSQLAVLALLAIEAGRQRGRLTHPEAAEMIEELRRLPGLVHQALMLGDQTDSLAIWLAEARDILFLGRGRMYPLALEGALKLKELSYIHAEGYPSGELKHGPIALVDKAVPVIVLAPHDELFEKTVSNMQEVMARGGQVLLATDRRGAEVAGQGVRAILTLPDVHDLWAPILYAIPAQLIAYHTALAKGTDVDQPRNLAKSVTVE